MCTHAVVLLSAAIRRSLGKIVIVSQIAQTSHKTVCFSYQWRAFPIKFELVSVSYRKRIRLQCVRISWFQFFFIEFATLNLYSTLLNCLSSGFFLFHFFFVDEAKLGWKSERDRNRRVTIKKQLIARVHHTNCQFWSISLSSRIDWFSLVVWWCSLKAKKKQK